MKKATITNLDAHRDARLMKLVDMLCERLENPKISTRELIMGLGVIGRVRISYLKLPPQESTNVGSAVRKYTAQFAANAARRGAKLSRSAAAAAADDAEWESDDEPA